jgi:hypothetical protein
MSLSICCLTASPGRAAATLAGLRQVADEIVVAVDVSGGELDLTPLGAVADRLFQIELDGFSEQALAWLHEQCSAEWILRIDDDEVPSVNLLEQLPELTQARDVVQYWLARRSLHPDARHWLDEWPWFPDFQGRLVRNDGRLWFSGQRDSDVALTLPARYLDSGLYRVKHLLRDRANSDAISGARIAAVDQRDHDAIDVVLGSLAAARPAAAAIEARAQCATRAEVRARWAERDFDQAGYRATIRAIDLHRHLIVDDHRPFRVCVRNDGSEWWPGGEDRRPLIRSAYRWLTPEGVLLEGEGHRTALPHPLGPGESCLVEMNVTAPHLAGRYLLAPDLVHEHVRWFQCQAEPVEMLITAPDEASR